MLLLFVALSMVSIVCSDGVEMTAEFTIVGAPSLVPQNRHPLLIPT